MTIRTKPTLLFFVGIIFLFSLGFGLSPSFAFAQSTACVNLSPLPTGFALPCPVLSVSPVSVPQSGTLSLFATPQAGINYLYTTAYYLQGNTWQPVSLQGSSPYSGYSNVLTTGTLPASVLANLSLGANYVISWDWLWDASAHCYKGPGLNKCNTGAWRVTSFTLSAPSSGGGGGGGTPPPSPSDTTPPTASLTAPSPSSTLAGTATISATAADNVGVASVQFAVDGVALGAPITTVPYQVFWNTFGVTNGIHSLRAVAKDAAGNTGSSVAVSVTVTNSPTVTWKTPLNGASLTGTVQLTAAASSSGGNPVVQFVVDGLDFGSPVAAPLYQATWNTATATNGTHTLRAKATDIGGNQSITNIVTVTVANAGTPPPPPGSTTADLTVSNAVNNAAPLPGTTINYTVKVTNLGPASSTGVLVTDLLPSGLTFVSAQASQGTYTAGTGAWAVGTLLPNASANIVMNATVNNGTSGQTIANTATATESAALTDPNLTNNAASASLTVGTVQPPPPPAAPSITSLSPTSGLVGAPVTITGATFGSTQGTSTVTLNGLSATPTSWSSSSISISVPSGASTGNIFVTVGGQKSNGLAFTVTTNTPPPPPPSGGADNRYCLSGNVANFGSTDGPAQLPQTCFYTALAATPSNGKIWTVTDNSSMVTALAGAACGDIVRITAGTVLTGTWNLSKSCDSAHWITIESSGVLDSRFPTEGTRMSPCWSGYASIPNRPAYLCSSPATLTAKIVVGLGASGAFNFPAGASYYRIVGLELTRTPSPGIVYNYVNVGLSSGTPQNHIIIDRDWIHGQNQDGNWPMTSGFTDSQKGVFFGQGNNLALIDSYISDIYCTSSGLCSDAQAIAGGIGGSKNTGWGTYKIVNNHLEGSTEGILFGGASGPALTPAGCTVGVNCNVDVPSDAEVRRNLFFKPLSWNGNTTNVIVTGYPVEKNGWEMKTGARWLFEGNIMQNTWYGAQPGYAFDIAPKNQGGGNPVVGSCWTCLTNDFTVRYNYATNVAYGMAFYASQDTTCTVFCPSQGANGISIHDNVIDDINNGQLSAQSLGDDHEFTANKGSPLNNVSIVHNTISRAIRAFSIWGADSAGLMNNWTYENNITANGNYGFLGMHQTSASCDNGFYTALSILNACITPYTFDHNIVMGGTSPANWPAGNFFPAASAVGFTNFNGGNGAGSPAGYQLLTTSPYHNAGSDGKDIGADINAVSQAIQGNQY